jgi:hypothetical protein
MTERHMYWNPTAFAVQAQSSGSDARAFLATTHCPPIAASPPTNAQTGCATRRSAIARLCPWCAGLVGAFSNS